MPSPQPQQPPLGSGQTQVRHFTLQASPNGKLAIAIVGLRGAHLIVITTHSCNRCLNINRNMP